MLFMFFYKIIYVFIYNVNSSKTLEIYYQIFLNMLDLQIKYSWNKLQVNLHYSNNRTIVIITNIINLKNYFKIQHSCGE